MSNITDGFFLDEDRLLQNGIIITDDRKGGNATRAEVMQLTNLLEESFEALREGCEEEFDAQLHLDGTQSTEALEGLDTLISTTLLTNVGGINPTTNSWWDNNRILNVAQADLLDDMETQYRECTRYGGRPDKIIAGEIFIDTYRQAIRAAGQYEFAATSAQNWDAGINSEGTDSGLMFKGVPITWDPNFQQLDTDYSPTIDWVKRAYFVNTKHLRLRPAQGHDMVSRRPPREYNRYVHYWALTWKGALTINKRRSQSVMSVA